MPEKNIKIRTGQKLKIRTPTIKIRGKKKKKVKTVQKQNWKYSENFRKKITHSRDWADVIIDNMAFLGMLFLIGAVSPILAMEAERAD